MEELGNARKRAEAVPMLRRAYFVWQGFSKKEIYCGVEEPTLIHVAFDMVYAKEANQKTIGEGLRRYKDFSKLCPRGVKILDETQGLASHQQIKFLIQHCPLDAPLNQAIYKYVGPMTFLYTQALAHHLKQNGIFTQTHEILINTLLLSNAQSNEERRGK